MILNFRFYGFFLLKFFMNVLKDCMKKLGKKMKKWKKLSVNDSLDDTIDLHDPTVLSLKKISKG